MIFGRKNRENTGEDGRRANGKKIRKNRADRAARSRRTGRWGAVLLCGAFCLSMLGGCGEAKKDPTEKNTLPEGMESMDIAKRFMELLGGNGDLDLQTPPENEIIFFSDFVNGAWSYSHSGIFILGDGRVYEFDFDQQMFPLGDGASDKEKYDLIMKFTEPVAEMDKEFMTKAYSLGKKIDPNAKMDLENTACDAGEDRLIFRDPATDFTYTIYEDGDSTGGLDDRYAKKLKELWDDEFKQAYRSSGKAQPDHLFTPGDIPMASLSDFSYHARTDSMGISYYVLKGETALKKYAGDFGAKEEDLLQALRDSVTGPYNTPEPNWEEYYFFLQVEVVPTTGYTRETVGFLFGDETFRFLPSEENHDPGSAEAVGEALMGHIYIAAVYQYDLYSTTVFLLPDGGKWEVLE